VYSAYDLRCHAKEALSVYLRWIEQVESCRALLFGTAETLAFPHGHFRAGQRDMSALIFRAARDRGIVMCEAPTGIGKTLGSLFAAVKALGQELVSQVVYLSAKTSGQSGAYVALESMQQSGLKISALFLRARAQSCFCLRGEACLDDNGRCSMTMGFHDRVAGALDELIGAGLVSAEVLDDIARRHQLCPSALAQQLLPWASVVVCDYNYVFDPVVRLGSLCDRVEATLVLADESHNLVERGRDMYSASMDRIACLDFSTQVQSLQPLLAKRLKSLANRLSELGSSQLALSEPLVELPQPLFRAVNKVMESLQDTGEFDHGFSGGGGLAEKTTDDIAQWRMRLWRFRVIAELYGDTHRTLIESSHVGRRRQVVVNLRCLDAASAIGKQCKRFHSMALFSASLHPLWFYRESFGLQESTPCLSVPSPFAQDQMLLCHARWIDTRYRQRAASLPQLVEVVHRLVCTREGNYLVFLPSYQYLVQVHEAFKAAYPDIETWAQERGQQSDVRNALLERLKVPGLRVGFAIMGGVFGEGIDYVGNLLIGLVVVGTGLPPNNVERELIANIYDSRGHNGHDYAYRYPGFTRVLQTTGRLIRTESDKGVVLLVDQRFSTLAYRNLYPKHWVLESINCVASLGSRIESFWNK